MKLKIFTLITLIYCLATTPLIAQPVASMYGDKVKADVKLHYVYTLEEALQQAQKENKPIFFNCFADWAIPCHAMNKYVFSDQQFADYMNNHFVNLYIDVSQRENKAIAQHYHINTFAHYLILDHQGKVIQRIVGGSKKEKFLKDIQRALHPKTSLAATEKAYKKGKRSNKLLREYLYNLNLAGDTTQFYQIGTIFLSQLKEKEYTKPENWLIFSKMTGNTHSELYDYLIQHKAAFVKHIGESKVNRFIEQLLYAQIIDMVAGNVPYQPEKMMQYYLQIQEAQLPANSLIRQLYHVGKLCGEKHYQKLFEYMQKHGEQFEPQRTTIELSFMRPDMTEQQRQTLAAYYTLRAKATKGSSSQQFTNAATQLTSTEGIHFTGASFEKAKEEAKKQNKLLFIDCYTTWCGPCKMLAKKVFPLPEVGAVFNQHFISLKIDMEKGEGTTLAKQWKIDAYPTMLILDAEGNELKRIVGAISPKALLKDIAPFINQ